MRFVTLDVFTTTRFGGNPLAVFPDARGLAEAEMQALAAELNLSETAFVLPPADPANTARLRIFTPKLELPFAGHPNVGTGWLLAEEGSAAGAPLGPGDGLRLEQAAGPVGVAVARDAAGAVREVTIDAPRPLSLGTRFTPVQVAASAGIEPWDVVTERHPPLVASVGNPFAVMQVTPEALSRAAPDAAGMARADAIAPELAGRFRVYLYAWEGARLRARMFGGGLGVMEDAATGSAAAPLAALLLHLSGAAEGAWEVVQGVEMGRPSLLRAAARRGADGIRATVGGACVRVLEGTATL